MIKETNMFAKLFSSATFAHAHCDLYCGVYDTSQAKIEALSVLKTAKKYAESDDEARYMVDFYDDEIAHTDH